MLVFAHHTIKDPEFFWEKAKKITSNLPPNLKVHGTYPSADGKLATCFWEADSVKQVQKYLDDVTLDSAVNVCYELNVEESVGLPAIDHEEHA
jgi:hypothetical protein